MATMLVNPQGYSYIRRLKRVLSCAAKLLIWIVCAQNDFRRIRTTGIFRGVMILAIFMYLTKIGNVLLLDFF